ncbi:MAG TPA: carboxypeptidase-like regulatory domain-containing protein [Planctomycetota bacterium]|nr:carboxypeptidase-like regulatory domain-containing protein [Planctomycetota bacterium]
MRRLGIAVVVLLLALWGIWRALDGGTSTEAPRAARAPQPEAQHEVAELVDLEPEAPARVTAAQVDEPDASATEGAADAEESPWFRGAVRVLDVENRPIEGARVWVPRFAAVPEQVTDAQGRCTLRGGDVQLMMVEFAAQAEGWFPGGGMLVGEPEHVVRLHRVRFASGRVLDAETRAPVADARVATRLPGRREVDGDAVRTDASGRFDGLAVPDGQGFGVDVSARGYLPTYRSMSIAGEPEDPASALELLLGPAQPGWFQVVDSGDGRPVPGAQVSTGREALATDFEGRVCCESSFAPSDLVHRPTVEAPGYCSASFEVRGLGTPDAPIVLRLPQACRVEGLVRPAEGEALPHFRFHVSVDRELSSQIMQGVRIPEGPYSGLWPENARWRGSLEGELDPGEPGRFVIPGVPPGLSALELALYVDAGTLARRRIGPLGAPGSVLRVDWPLEPAGTAGLTGRILLAGEAHPGFVRVVRDGLERVYTTGDDGHFVFEALSPGELELYGELRGGRMRWGELGTQSGSVVVVQGQVATRDVEFQFEVATIGGVLLDAHESPVGGVLLRAKNAQHGVEVSCESGADGSWSFRVPVVESPYLLSCARPLRETELEFLAGSEGIELHEVAYGRLRFRALDAVTGEVLRSPILAKPVEGNFARPISASTWPDMDPSGWCEKDLPAGPVEIGVFASDDLHRPERRVLEIPADGVCEAEFRLDPAVSVELRLGPEGGPLPANHVVLLLPEAEWGLVTADTDRVYPKVSFAALPFDPTRQRDLRLEPGRARTVGRLAPGRYRFKVFPDDIAIEPEWIDVPAEGVVDVRWSTKP